jgi:AhpD family alkylhydroperoxidase
MEDGMRLSLTRKSTALAGFALIVAGLVAAPLSSPAAAGDITASEEEVYKEIAADFGGTLPAFVKQLPKAAVAGAWREEKDLEISDRTALTPKVKALISLAVAAQIPCTYCIWADTNNARRAGATEEEIAEAVGMAAVTRHWSTLFNGLQVDFTQFKKDLGGDVAPVAAK